MADFGIYTKNVDIQAFAGVNANATAKATAATDVYVLDVEAGINAETGFNWSDAFAALDADVSGMLKTTGAVKCAINVINWDIDAIGRGTANLMINILLDIYNRNIKILKEKDKQAWMVAVT